MILARRFNPIPWTSWKDPAKRVTLRTAFTPQSHFPNRRRLLSLPAISPSFPQASHNVTDTAEKERPDGIGVPNPAEREHQESADSKQEKHRDHDAAAVQRPDAAEEVDAKPEGEAKPTQQHPPIIVKLSKFELQMEEQHGPTWRDKLTPVQREALDLKEAKRRRFIRHWIEAHGAENAAAEVEKARAVREAARQEKQRAAAARRAETAAQRERERAEAKAAAAAPHQNDGPLVFPRWKYKPAERYAMHKEWLQELARAKALHEEESRKRRHEFELALAERKRERRARKLGILESQRAAWLVRLREKLGEKWWEEERSLQVKAVFTPWDETPSQEAQDEAMKQVLDDETRVLRDAEIQKLQAAVLTEIQDLEEKLHAQDRFIRSVFRPPVKEAEKTLELKRAEEARQAQKQENRKARKFKEDKEAMAKVKRDKQAAVKKAKAAKKAAAIRHTETIEGSKGRINQKGRKGSSDQGVDGRWPSRSSRPADEPTNEERPVGSRASF